MRDLMASAGSGQLAESRGEPELEFRPRLLQGEHPAEERGQDDLEGVAPRPRIEVGQDRNGVREEASRRGVEAGQGWSSVGLLSWASSPKNRGGAVPDQGRARPLPRDVRPGPSISTIGVQYSVDRKCPRPRGSRPSSDHPEVGSDRVTRARPRSPAVAGLYVEVKTRCVRLAPRAGRAGYLAWGNRSNRLGEPGDRTSS